MKRIYTKGNVEVQNIKIEDILYEYEYGMGIKSKVISLPKETLEGYWEWQNQVEGTGKIKSKAKGDINIDCWVINETHNSLHYFHLRYATPDEIAQLGRKSIILLS